MSFKEIYQKVENLKDLSIESILERYSIQVIFMDVLPFDKLAIQCDQSIVLKNGLKNHEYKLLVLHEIGHYLFDRKCYYCNHRTEENNANIFMCLYLVHNEIWDDQYFDEYLIYQGIEPKVARYFNDCVWQFKRQQILQTAY